MKPQFILVLLALLLAACGNTPAQPSAADIEKTAAAIVQTRVARTQTALPSVTPPPATLTLTPKYTLIHPTPLPTKLTIPATIDSFQAEQHKEIRHVLDAYFELRYQELSITPPEKFQVNGFGDLVSSGPEAMDFLVTEIAKLSVERKWTELNRLRYAKYEYSLEYKDIALDASAKVATVSLLEEFVIVTERAMERNPDMPSITEGDQTHQIVLQNEQGQWKIVSDIYQDAWWRSYRKPGMSTDEILRKINAELQKLEAMPSATPWSSPTP